MITASRHRCMHGASILPNWKNGMKSVHAHGRRLRAKVVDWKAWRDTCDSVIQHVDDCLHQECL